jgi:hypothetical protein
VTRPESTPLDVWQEVTDAAAKALDAMPENGPQLRKHRVENVARVILAERERWQKERDDLLDQIDTLKNIDLPCCAHEFTCSGVTRLCVNKKRPRLLAEGVPFASGGFRST